MRADTHVRGGTPALLSDVDRRWYAVLLAIPALYIVVNGVRFVANGDGVGVALLLLRSPARASVLRHV